MLWFGELITDTYVIDAHSDIFSIKPYRQWFVRNSIPALMHLLIIPCHYWFEKKLRTTFDARCVVNHTYMPVILCENKNTIYVFDTSLDVHWSNKIKSSGPCLICQRIRKPLDYRFIAKLVRHKTSTTLRNRNVSRLFHLK